jgi:phosphopentomutase
MHRENGYYWVKTKSCWKIAYWSDGEDIYPGHWSLAGMIGSFQNEDFDEINETRIIRAE